MANITNKDDLDQLDPIDKVLENETFIERMRCLILYANELESIIRDATAPRTAARLIRLARHRAVFHRGPSPK